jgi:tRNA pseudouridine38-40 synthase
MVRNIVGTMVDIGRGRWPVSYMADVLATRDRRQAGPTAPAHGLCLVSVEYPEDRAAVDRPGAPNARGGGQAD